MNSFNRLIELFGKFPGIGPRQARRFVYFLLVQNSSYIDEFISLLKSLKQEVSICPSCKRFFVGKHAAAALCSLCGAANRTRKELMVVEKDVDVDAIEKSGTYDGLYFVFGGTIAILEKDPEERARLKDLEKTVAERIKKDSLSELILALSATLDGEHTADYLSEKFKPLAQTHNFKITTLGRGLSTGTELEYSDAETIKNALKNRA